MSIQDFAYRDRRVSEDRFLFGPPSNGLFRQTNFDETEFPSLSDFRRRVQDAAESVHPPEQHTVVLFMNLEQLGNFRGALFEHRSRAVINEISERLNNALDDKSVVSRLSLDQYIILLPKVESLDAINETAQRLFAQFSQPFPIAGRIVRTSVSIGIGVQPFDGMDADTLVRRASAAMTFAQSEGGNRYHFCTQHMSDIADERFILSTDIKPAIRRGEFVIDFQPRIDTSNGRIAGMEALVRWRHPELGLIEPDRFIPIAESSNAIIELGEWVLNTSLKRMREWIDAGIEPGRIAVNVSARQMIDPAFVDIVLRALSVSGVPAGKLEIELTESLLITDMSKTINAMDELASTGVIFSIDDFGTGYASLEYLRRLPVNVVKIDQSFIRNIATGLSDAALIRAIITMITDLGFSVIAEGVENQAQLNTLRDTACSEIQGFLFSRPLTAGEAAILLSTRPAFAL